MTTEEAIKILEKEFDKSCGNYRYQNAKKLDFEDALWMAISALRTQQERENPKPLTLEELREMDGEPVWCVDGSGNEMWGLVNAEHGEPDVIDHESGLWRGDFYNMTGNGKRGLHPMGWLAYRHKTKE